MSATGCWVLTSRRIRMDIWIPMTLRYVDIAALLGQLSMGIMADNHNRSLPTISGRSALYVSCRCSSWPLLSSGGSSCS